MKQPRASVLLPLALCLAGLAIGSGGPWVNIALGVPPTDRIPWTSIGLTLFALGALLRWSLIERRVGQLERLLLKGTRPPLE